MGKKLYLFGDLSFHCKREGVIVDICERNIGSKTMLVKSVASSHRFKVDMELSDVIDISLLYLRTGITKRM
jgi:hypothetical protein